MAKKKRKRPSLKTTCPKCLCPVSGLDMNTHKCVPASKSKGAPSKKEEIVKKLWVAVDNSKSQRADIMEDSGEMEEEEEGFVREPYVSAHHVPFGDGETIFSKEEIKQEWTTGSIKMELIDYWFQHAQISEGDRDLLLQILTDKRLANSPIPTPQEYKKKMEEEQELVHKLVVNGTKVSCKKITNFFIFCFYF
jgi:hypothetical protein